MENDSIIDIFLEYFLIFKLRDYINYLPAHVDHPQENTTSFLNSIQEIASKLNFEDNKFNELLNIYLDNSNKENLKELNDFLSSYFYSIVDLISEIPNDLNKASCVLKGLINSKYFDFIQIYDAIVFFKEDVSVELINEITVNWKDDKEYYLSQNSLPPYSDIFWYSRDGMYEIDNISMWRFQETFDIKGFDNTFKEVKKELEETLMEFLPPYELEVGPFYLWLADRVPSFLKNYYDLTKFLEVIAGEQSPSGNWDDKNVIKSTFVDEDTNEIKYIEYGISSSNNALCSILLLKHSKYDILRDKGIKGANWLLNNQNSDGSWSDEIKEKNGKIQKKKSLFATLLSLEALIRSEIPNIDTQIELSFQWIMNKQNRLGMWLDDKFQPLFRYSTYPLMTILILELETLLRSYKLTLKELDTPIIHLDNERPYEFDIAVSYAGEDRDIVEKYVRSLEKNSIKVFYDKDNQRNLWGKNLVDELHDIYKDKATYCVMFISKSYTKTKWANHERQAAQERALSEHEEYILPVKLDDTEINGMPTTINYFDLTTNTLEELVRITIEKLK